MQTETEFTNQLKAERFVSSGAGIYTESTNGGKWIPLRKWHIYPSRGEAVYYMRKNMDCSAEWVEMRSVAIVAAR